MRRWQSVLLLIVIGLLAVYAVLAALARPRPEIAFFERGADVLVMAHQGGDGLWPSNTLYAFERAVELGVDVLELDVHSSSDGVLVVIHDDTVDRTTDGSGRVNELTLAELRALDAGYDWSPERAGESFPFRDQGLTIPTLAEVFEAFPDHRINIEIKQLSPGIVAPLCELIRAYGREESVLVGSFHDTALSAFRSACPEVATSAGPGEVRRFFVLSTAFLGALFRPVADAFQVPEYQGELHVVTSRFVQAAQGKNVDVHVWTVDEPADMERLIALGVDGIITDRPDRLLALLGRPVGDVRVPGVPE